MVISSGSVFSFFVLGFTGIGFEVEVSGLPYVYLCSIVLDVLTPHVLSEWMVEVCRFDKYGVLFPVLG